MIIATTIISAPTIPNMRWLADQFRKAMPWSCNSNEWRGTAG